MEPLDRAPDGLGAELERVDRDPLVRGVDQLRELERPSGSRIGRKP